MTRNKSLWFLVLALVIGGVIWLAKMPGKSGKLDDFATCISNNGAKYYAAFWCPNCKNQEAMFGRSSRLLPRIECSTPDGRGQLPVCQEADVKGYPTWEFADGTREVGTQPLETLSSRTHCALPETQ